MVFLSQKVDGNMIFTDYWKVLVLTFSEMGNTVFSWAKKLTEIWYLLITGKFLFWTFRWWEIRSFFESRSWCKDDIYWLTRSSCFELFGDGKYGFFSQKVDGKMMYTWSFWAFHDIPGSGKYDFSCNVLALKQNFTIFLLHQIKDSRYLSRHTLFFWPELSLVYSLKFLSAFFFQIISSLQ